MFEYVSSQIQTPKGELYPNSSIDIAKNMNLELCPSLSYLITFFKAYPIRIPTKKPPPKVAAVGPKLSTMLPYFRCGSLV
jgi:hypothetical protein